MNSNFDYYSLEGEHFNLNDNIETFREEPEVYNNTHELHLLPQELHCSKDGSAELAFVADSVEAHILDMVYGSKIRGGLQFHDGLLQFTPAKKRTSHVAPKLKLADFQITSFPRETRFSISFENEADLDEIRHRLRDAVEHLEQSLPNIVAWMNADANERGELSERIKDERRRALENIDALALQQVIDPKNVNA